MSIWCATHSHGIPDLPRCPQCEIDALRARVAELEAVIKESIRNHRQGCPCPRCTAVIPQPTFDSLK